MTKQKIKHSTYRDIFMITNNLPFEQQLNALSKAPSDSRWIATGQGSIIPKPPTSSIFQRIWDFISNNARMEKVGVEYQLMCMLTDGASSNLFTDESDLARIQKAARYVGLLKGNPRSENNHAELKGVVDLISKQIHHKPVDEKAYQTFVEQFYQRNKSRLKKLFPKPKEFKKPDEVLTVQPPKTGWFSRFRMPKFLPTFGFGRSKFYNPPKNEPKLPTVDKADPHTGTVKEIPVKIEEAESSRSQTSHTETTQTPALEKTPAAVLPPPVLGTPAVTDPTYLKEPLPPETKTDQGNDSVSSSTQPPSEPMKSDGAKETLASIEALLSPKKEPLSPARKPKTPPIESNARTLSLVAFAAFVGLIGLSRYAYNAATSNAVLPPLNTNPLADLGNSFNEMSTASAGSIISLPPLPEIPPLFVPGSIKLPSTDSIKASTPEQKSTPDGADESKTTTPLLLNGPAVPSTPSSLKPVPPPIVKNVSSNGPQDENPSVSAPLPLPAPQLPSQPGPAAADLLKPKEDTETVKKESKETDTSPPPTAKAENIKFEYNPQSQPPSSGNPLTYLFYIVAGIGIPAALVRLGKTFWPKSTTNSGGGSSSGERAAGGGSKDASGNPTDGANGGGGAAPTDAADDDEGSAGLDGGGSDADGDPSPGDRSPVAAATTAAAATGGGSGLPPPHSNGGTPPTSPNGTAALTPPVTPATSPNGKGSGGAKGAPLKPWITPQKGTKPGSKKAEKYEEDLPKVDFTPFTIASLNKTLFEKKGSDVWVLGVINACDQSKGQMDLAVVLTEIKKNSFVQKMITEQTEDAATLHEEDVTKIIGKMADDESSKLGNETVIFFTGIATAFARFEADGAVKKAASKAGMLALNAYAAQFIAAVQKVHGVFDNKKSSLTDDAKSEGQKLKDILAGIRKILKWARDIQAKFVAHMRAYEKSVAPPGSSPTKVRFSVSDEAGSADPNDLKALPPPVS